MDIDQVEIELQELKTRLVKSELKVEQLEITMGQINQRMGGLESTFTLLKK
jgi:hypothetical protein